MLVSSSIAWQQAMPIDREERVTLRIVAVLLWASGIVPCVVLGSWKTGI